MPHKCHGTKRLTHFWVVAVVNGLMEGVNLSGSEGKVPADKDLSNSKFMGVDLSGNSLSGFYLGGTDFSEAKRYLLTRTYLTQISREQTICRVQT